MSKEGRALANFAVTVKLGIFGMIIIITMMMIIIIIIIVIIIIITTTKMIIIIKIIIFFKLHLDFICKQKNLRFSSTLTVILSIVGHITLDVSISLYQFKSSGFSHSF